MALYAELEPQVVQTRHNLVNPTHGEDVSNADEGGASLDQNDCAGPSGNQPHELLTLAGSVEKGQHDHACILGEYGLDFPLAVRMDRVYPGERQGAAHRSGDRGQFFCGMA